MRKEIFLIGLVSFLISSKAFAQAIPFQNVSLRITPQHQTQNQGVLGSKTVVLDQDSAGYKITWYSIVKEFDESGDYPTYRIKSKRGVMTVGGWINKTQFLLPELWGQGYQRVDLTLPLWVDPEFLKLKGREKRTFNVGLLGNSVLTLRQAPPAVYERLSYFQNFYDQVIVGGEPQSTGLTKTDQRELKEFAKDYFFIGIVARSKASLTVNGKKESYPCVILGNDYYHLVVVDDPLNPVAISFNIFADKAPRIFRGVFSDLKNMLEFQVTQMTSR